MVESNNNSKESIESLIDSLDRNLKEKLRIDKNVEEITRKLSDLQAEKEENVFLKNGNYFLLTNFTFSTIKKVYLVQN